MVALVTPQERFLLLHDEWMVLGIAQSINDGIERICSRRLGRYRRMELRDDQIPPEYREQ